MARPFIISIGIAVALTFAGTVSAHAYDQLAYPINAESPLSYLEPGRDCIDCHGIVDPEAPENETWRSGPHGGYSSSTSKCGVCHSVHMAPSGFLLLPGPTIKSVCESCHDGTGGNGVYGVIKARTNQEPLSAHRIETTNVIPGGAADGGPRAQVFSGPGGTLTCTDCHSPHGNEERMVEPFVGDRYRSARYIDPESSEIATAYATASSRLLRRAPTGAETSVTVYGAGWCATCHQGVMSSSESTAHNHPVHEDDLLHYNRLPIRTALDSTETVLGPLGQSNLGYRMPELEGEPRRQSVDVSITPTVTVSVDPLPICQQCHEDVRDATQEFRITAPDGRPSNEETGGPSTDNPRFQVFPHESNARSLLIVPPGTSGAAYTDALCLNCHLTLE